MTKRRQAKLKDCRYWRSDGGLIVSVTVHNAQDRTMLVSCGIRQIQFDRESGTLTVWFSDHGRDPNARGGYCRLNSVPRTVPVAAGEEVELAGKIPAQLHHVIDRGENKIDFEVYDIQEVRSVQVHVAVAEAPFYFNPKGDSQVRQLIAWGDDSAGTARAADPPAASG